MALIRSLTFVVRAAIATEGEPRLVAMELEHVLKLGVWKLK